MNFDFINKQNSNPSCGPLNSMYYITQFKQDSYLISDISIFGIKARRFIFKYFFIRTTHGKKASSTCVPQINPVASFSGTIRTHNLYFMKKKLSNFSKLIKCWIFKAKTHFGEYHAYFPMGLLCQIFHNSY